MINLPEKIICVSGGKSMPFEISLEDFPPFDQLEMAILSDPKNGGKGITMQSNSFTFSLDSPIWLV